jgi:hypothetical protein
VKILSLLTEKLAFVFIHNNNYYNNIIMMKISTSKKIELHLIVIQLDINYYLIIQADIGNVEQS